MKKFKLTKGIIIILATIFVVVSGAIIVGSLSNDDVMAGDTSCDHTSNEIYVYRKIGDGTHEWGSTCVVCGAFLTSWVGNCTYGDWVPSANVAGTHAKYCTVCKYAGSTAKCSDGNGDGICDICSGTIGSSGSGSSSYTYKWFDSSIHHVYLNGDWYDAESHTSSSWKDQGDGTHGALCDKCGGTAQITHTEVKVTGKAATCTTTGLTDGKKCSVCNATTVAQKTISALGHTEVEIKAVAATCTTEGKTAGKKCSVCGVVTKAQTIVAALGHTEEEIPAVAATCTTEGKTAGKKCSVCGVVTKAQTTVVAFGHTEEEIPAVAATCTTAGNTSGVKCSVCNETITEPTRIEPTGHNYENGECTNCGQEDPNAQPEEPEQPDDLEISSDKYEFDETYISKVQPGTSIEELKVGLETNAIEIKIYNQDNEEISSTEKIGTGMRIELTKGEITKSFIIIVKGDSNGDGESDFKDIVRINQARLNRTTLEEVYSVAGDVTGDGEVDFKDLVKINRFRLNKITEL